MPLRACEAELRCDRENAGGSETRPYGENKKERRELSAMELPMQISPARNAGSYLRAWPAAAAFATGLAASYDAGLPLSSAGGTCPWMIRPRNLRNS